jgi:GTPase SAR1 family protein
MNPQLITPFSALIVGPSASGKSTFLSRFIEHVDEMVDRQFIEIIFCYSESQPLYETIKDPRVRFHEGVVKSSEFNPKDGPRLVILDDFMASVNGDIVDYFIKGSHHRDCSVIMLTQNMFAKCKGFRDISLNSHYIVLFRNVRDGTSINYIARQYAPNDVNHVVESYRDATSKKFGYILFDFRQVTEECMRLRTNLFPDDNGIIVYASKKAFINREYLLHI